jgi:hypothetical protein
VRYPGGRLSGLCARRLEAGHERCQCQQNQVMPHSTGAV